MFSTNATSRRFDAAPHAWRAIYLIGIFFLAFSTNASAEWTRFGNDRDSIIYVDTATLQRTGDSASVWILKDYREMQTGPSREKFKSAKIFYEFKCSEKTMRQSYLTRYFGPMGGAGPFPSDARFHPWTAIAPGTEKAMLHALVCK